jgi:hypothetical protein
MSPPYERSKARRPLFDTAADRMVSQVTAVLGLSLQRADRVYP